MSQETLATVEPTLSGELAPYIAAEQEPEFEIYLTSRRVDDGNFPHSEWRAAHVVEGVPHGELSQSQRQYISAVLNHVGIAMEGNLILTGKSDKERLIALARFARQRMKASTDLLFESVKGIAEKEGVEFAAQALGVKPYQVRHLLKSKRLELDSNDQNK